MDAPVPMPVARVVVDVATRALSEPFDYSIPDALSGDAFVGAPVLVPFGGQRVVGYVVERCALSGFEGALKPIEAVLGAALFAPHAFGLAAWIANEYVCPLADAMRLFLPPGGTPAAEAHYSAIGPRPTAPLKAAVHDRVSGQPGITAAALRSSDARFPAVASELARAGALVRTWTLRPGAVGAVDDRWAELSGVPFAPRPNATSQRAVLDALAAGPVRVAELTAELGDVNAALKRLEQEGAVLVTRRRRMRDPQVRERSAPRHDRLSDGQSAALAAIGSASPGGVVLLDGVTGSGKTEVYLRAIEAVVGAGGAAIVLVPEIALTPQTVGRFRARFGDTVAVLHSRLSAGERYDQWDRVRTQECRVVVGPRSALFAPAADVRLIVVDEEHEPSYKQGQTPRYHARAVAVRLAAMTGARVVLGSATPSFESRVDAEAGRALLVRMPDRVAGGTMPPVEIVDMTAEFSDGHRSMFSRPLTRELFGIAERGAKAVLFLNRRGFSSFMLCRDCGFVPRCDNCSVSLTYHEVGNRLVCHHCGVRSAVPARCPRCDGPYLRQFGAGTQRVETELAALVPGLPVVRMDADTTRGAGGHERRLAEFEALHAGVLLGTQMVAKGLDYPDVELVGVINADTTLHMPDFRAGERTYQLLEQVAGRAGRGPRGGRVVVQTYWPDHPALRAVATHDPTAFFATEAAERSALGYPPFGRLARVVFSGKDLGSVRTAATATADGLRAVAATGWTVMGPSPAPLAKVKSSFRWHVLVKAPAGADIPTVLADVIARTPATPGVSIAPDVDPAELM